MEFKAHNRKRSEIGRTRLLSDFYFENKQHKKRSVSWTKTSTPKTFDSLSDMIDLSSSLKNIQKLLTSGIDSIRSEDIPLFQSFLAILNTPQQTLHNLDLNQLIRTLKSKDLQTKFLNFNQNLKTKKNFGLAFQDSLRTSTQFFSKLDRALYGYPLTKSVCSFIEGCYKWKKIVFKPVRFIEYFESLPSPQSFFSYPSDWSKLFAPDIQIETTKDDEDNLYINTLGDEKEYEEIIDIDPVPVLNTEPDSRNRLVSMFFDKHASINPYRAFHQPLDNDKNLIRQVMLKRTDPKARSAKWDKYFTESIYLKKLGLEFVEFVRKLGENWKTEEADLVTWVYKNKGELIDQYLKSFPVNSQDISEVKHQAMVKHLGDKKTLRDLFKHY